VHSGFPFPITTRRMVRHLISPVKTRPTPNPPAGLHDGGTHGTGRTAADLTLIALPSAVGARTRPDLLVRRHIATPQRPGKDCPRLVQTPRQPATAEAPGASRRAAPQRRQPSGDRRGIHRLSTPGNPPNTAGRGCGCGWRHAAARIQTAGAADGRACPLALRSWNCYIRRPVHRLSVIRDGEA